jgi:hypothetical protein
LRHYLSGLARRKRTFYRCIDTLTAILKVFVAAYNKFGDYKVAHQILARHKPPSSSRLHKYKELPLGLTNFV